MTTPIVTPGETPRGWWRCLIPCCPICKHYYALKDTHNGTAEDWARKEGNFDRLIMFEEESLVTQVIVSALMLAMEVGMYASQPGIFGKDNFEPLGPLETAAFTCLVMSMCSHTMAILMATSVQLTMSLIPQTSRAMVRLIHEWDTGRSVIFVFMMMGNVIWLATMSLLVLSMGKWVGPIICWMKFACGMMLVGVFLTYFGYLLKLAHKIAVDEQCNPKKLGPLSPRWTGEEGQIPGTFSIDGTERGGPDDEGPGQLQRLTTLDRSVLAAIHKTQDLLREPDPESSDSEGSENLTPRLAGSE